jgi:hypothetical protein
MPRPKYEFWFWTVVERDARVVVLPKVSCLLAFPPDREAGLGAGLRVHGSGGGT